MHTHILCDGQARVLTAGTRSPGSWDRAANSSSNTAIYMLWRDLAPTAMTGPSSANYVAARANAAMRVA